MAKSKHTTPSKSRNSAKGIKRPFTAADLAEGRRLAEQYQVVVSSDEGHWYGRGLELPHVFGDGPSVEACIDNTREALAGAVAHLIETGGRPPASAKTGRRTEQVNVRLTVEEKLLLETSAKRDGFEGLSDFIRAAAIVATR